jgi:hypothetical protein
MKLQEVMVVNVGVSKATKAPAAKEGVESLA